MQVSSAECLGVLRVRSWQAANVFWVLFRSVTPSRKNASCGTRSAGRATSTGTGGMWRFYTEDSPGLKVGPVPVLVMSLLFIASVFMLHIWGKYTRS
ncbi:PREDICTED: protein transport protein Sec61 subunit beta [Haliaeetus leucocephalus]|nr:PREDICTED: protein transport protein Sec61 subunit beta [Haliaeetus leucocephalus]